MHKQDFHPKFWLVLIYSAIPGLFAHYLLTHPDVSLSNSVYVSTIWIACFVIIGGFFAFIFSHTILKDRWFSSLVIVYLHLLIVLILPAMIFAGMFFIAQWDGQLVLNQLKDQIVQFNQIEYQIMHGFVWQRWYLLLGYPSFALLLKVLLGHRVMYKHQKGDLESPIKIV